MRKIFLILSAAVLTQTGFAQIDRTKPPKAGPAPVIKIADPVTTRLPNGITVMVVENHKLPKVSASLYIDQGPITEGNKAGVLNLMGGMLNEGTAVRSKAAFDEAVDKMGADVGLSSSGGSASALTRYFDSAFMLMAEAIKKPSFPQESFDKLKSQTLTGMKADEKNVSAIAARVTNALAYGLNHPVGEFQTEETVNGLTLADVKKAYAQYITPARAYLTFVGDITPAKAQALAAKAFGAWKGAPLSLEKLPVVPNPSTTEINLVDMPNAVQSEIKVINLVSLPMSSPDYFAALLANQILGGGSEGRLFMNLRERHGFTYGSYSSLGSGRFQSAFMASAAVRNAKTDSAIQEMLNEIDTLRTRPVTKEELDLVKAKYNGSFAMGLENPGNIASYARNILINNLPKDFYRTYLAKIEAVTAADIERVAKKYIHHTDTRVVVTGKASEIKESLEKLGYPVKVYDKFAQPVDAAGKTAASVNVDGKTIIQNYLKAIGGMDALNKINSLLVEGSMAVQGMNLKVVQKKQSPNKELVTIEMNGSVVSKNVFDGNNGFAMQMGQKQEMDPDEIAEKKAKKHIIDQVAYLGEGYKLEVEGTEAVDGKQAYKVVVTPPSGKSQTEYYDVQNGLLVKEEKQTVMGPMTLQNTVTYSDYRKVGDVMMPFSQAVSVVAGGQEQNMEMKFSAIKLNEGVKDEDFK